MHIARKAPNAKMTKNIKRRGRNCAVHTARNVPKYEDDEKGNPLALAFIVAVLLETNFKAGNTLYCLHPLMDEIR